MEWKYNEVGINVEPERAFYQINSLQEVLDVIHQHIQGETDDSYTEHHHLNEKSHLLH
ncbi:hypothetical protein [Niallia endozanthoxylica]|uniref:hypothetical protein n=1 Tax=Niallia endozanthoxylica TaxID=2036016 RepID=UPI00168B8E1D|nr:hypothetical protein [Niallia endozanthoxylica]